MNDNIGKKLGLQKFDINKEIENLPELSEEDQVVVERIERSLQNIDNIAKLSGGALEELIKVAKSSMTPRAYEVVALLVEKVVEANKVAIEMELKRKEANGELDRQNVTNNLFVGSTYELQQLLKSRREQDVIDVESEQVDNDGDNDR